MTEKDKEINELRRENAKLKIEVKKAYNRGIYEAYYKASDVMRKLLHDATTTDAGLDVPEASDSIWDD